ncbi:MAG: hypothetical protein RMY28_024335 [Nostoc sp. ChiSLP01]|nr:hypothetical protein [Nostoc sp. CmiSLP01]MDZ8289619.1 hypothetical protein [Nostoc sp. ChiSLP01]
MNQVTDVQKSNRIPRNQKKTRAIAKNYIYRNFYGKSFIEALFFVQ